MLLLLLSSLGPSAHGRTGLTLSVWFTISGHSAGLEAKIGGPLVDDFSEAERQPTS